MNSLPSVNQCYVMNVQDESQRALDGEYEGSGGINSTVLLTSRPSGSNFGGSSSKGRGERWYEHLQR